MEEASKQRAISDEDELMAAQRAFLRSQIKPSARVLRVVKHGPELPPHMKEKEKPKSESVKRNPQVQAEPFVPVVKSVIEQKKQTLQPVEVPQLRDGKTHVYSNRTGFPVLEKEIPRDPTPKSTQLSKKKPSLFMQRLAAKARNEPPPKITAQHRPTAAPVHAKSSYVTPSRESKEIHSVKPLSQSSKDIYSKMRAEVHAENEKKLNSMSVEQVEAEIAALREQFSPELLNIIKNRGQKKETSVKKVADTSTSSSQQLDINSSAAFALDNLQAEEVQRPPLQSFEQFTVSQKQEWMKPVDRQEEEKRRREEQQAQSDLAAKLFLQWRVDFDGKVVLSTTKVPTHIGLHHHGKDADRAGYTLEEIIMLCQSSAHQQRSRALHMLSNVLLRAGRRRYRFPEEYTDDLPAVLAHMFAKDDEKSINSFNLLVLEHAQTLQCTLVIRASLDIMNVTVVDAALVALHSLLTVHPSSTSFSEKLVAQDRAFESYRGCEMTYLVNIEDKGWNIDLYDRKEGIDNLLKSESIEDDLELCRDDIVLGLLQMGVLDRFAYLLAHLGKFLPRADIMFQCCLYFTSHSELAARKVLASTVVIKATMDVITSLLQKTDPSDNFVSSDNNDIDFKQVDTVALGIRFFTALAQTSKLAARTLLGQNVMGAVVRCVLAANLDKVDNHSRTEEPTMLASPLAIARSVAGLRFWRVLLCYGLGSKAFTDVYPVMLRVLLADGPQTRPMYALIECLSRALSARNATEVKGDSKEETYIATAHDSLLLTWSHVGVHVEEAFRFLAKAISNKTSQPVPIVSGVISFLAAYYEEIVSQGTVYDHGEESARLQQLLQQAGEDGSMLPSLLTEVDSKLAPATEDLLLNVARFQLAVMQLGGNVAEDYAHESSPFSMVSLAAADLALEATTSKSRRLLHYYCLRICEVVHPAVFTLKYALRVFPVLLETSLTPLALDVLNRVVFNEKYYANEPTMNTETLSALEKLFVTQLCYASPNAISEEPTLLRMMQALCFHKTQDISSLTCKSVSGESCVPLSEWNGDDVMLNLLMLSHYHDYPGWFTLLMCPNAFIYEDSFAHHPYFISYVTWIASLTRMDAVHTPARSGQVTAEDAIVVRALLQMYNEPIIFDRMASTPNLKTQLDVLCAAYVPCPPSSDTLLPATTTTSQVYNFSGDYFLLSNWGTDISQFLRSLVRVYCSDSLGDVSFSTFMLQFFRMNFPSAIRKLLWTEAGTFFAFSSNKRALPMGLDVQGFLFPVESNVPLLNMYKQALSAPTQQRLQEHPDDIKSQDKKMSLYRYVCHHLACFIFEVDRPADQPVVHSQAWRDRQLGGYTDKFVVEALKEAALLAARVLDVDAEQPLVKRTQKLIDVSV